MMKRTYAVAMLAILICGASATNGFGCSLLEGVLFPSNYDRVKQAEAIVLADAVSLETKPPIETADSIFFIMPKLAVRTVEAIKGNFAGGTVTVSPVSSCFGYDYRAAVSKRVLLFLYKDNDGIWNVDGAPFGSINGQESGVNGPWEGLVRHYAQIDRLKDDEQEKVALRNLQQAARTDPRNYPVGLDKDIEEHFNTPYPTKSYKDLFELYSKGTATQRRDALWALAKGGHKEARALMESLMRSSNFEDYVGPVTAYVNTTKDHSSVEALGGAYLGIAKQNRWPIMMSLIQLARESDMGLMIQVLKSADIEEASKLSAWFVRHPDDEATQILRKLVGSEFNDSARLELALSLAALGDKAIVDYAREAVASTKGAERVVSFRIEQSAAGWKRRSALSMLAYSPLPEADALTREVIADGNLEDIAQISESLLSSIDPNRWQRLRGIPNLKAIDEMRNNRLRETLENLAKGGEADAKLLLDRLK